MAANIDFLLTFDVCIVYCRFHHCKGGRAIKCPYCGAENVDLEPDEDGDLVCEECGEILDVVVSCLQGVDGNKCCGRVVYV